MVIKEKSCGAVIFRVRGGDGGMERLYMILKYRWGHWGFVKGHVEEGEDCIRTAKREAEEETGLAERQLKFIPGFSEKIYYFYTTGGRKMHKEVTYFLAEYSMLMESKLKLSSEHTDYAWLPHSEAIKMLTYENDRRVLERAEEFLNKK